MLPENAPSLRYDAERVCEEGEEHKIDGNLGALVAGKCQSSRKWQSRSRTGPQHWGGGPRKTAAYPLFTKGITKGIKKGIHQGIYKGISKGDLKGYF